MAFASLAVVEVDSDNLETRVEAAASKQEQVHTMVIACCCKQVDLHILQLDHRGKCLGVEAALVGVLCWVVEMVVVDYSRSYGPSMLAFSLCLHLLGHCHRSSSCVLSAAISLLLLIFCFRQRTRR